MTIAVMNTEMLTSPGTAASEQKPAGRMPAPLKPTIVYACSGCSDAGEIADHVARQLSREGAAQMSCLAGIGGRVKSLVMKAENAQRILVVDGCPLNCAAHTLRLAGFKNFEHLELHKIRIRKGSCPVTDDKIAAGVDAAKKILSSEPALTEDGDSSLVSLEAMAK
jgi:uncharacterized metal-binding protein